MQPFGYDLEIKSYRWYLRQDAKTAKMDEKGIGRWW